MGKNGCKSSAETGHCLGQICFSRTFVMVNWNSWRTGGYEWLMWQKRPAGLGWNFRNEKDKCLIKVCVCVCIFCHVDVVYVSVFMLETNTFTCCECFFHTVIVFWGTMLVFLAILNCVETLPQDPYSAKVAAANPSADSHKLRPWNIKFAQTQQ